MFTFNSLCYYARCILVAVSGDDFVTLIDELIVTPGNVMECITVRTTEDDILEDDEQFIIQAETDDRAVMIVEGNVTVNILDDDGNH